ncbi:MAG TPA: ATP synthase delta/epsilon chain alpha-helix domain-containing protein, partial [Thermomicrobiaceae bacterium]|nr:ATP synthase delta/epsilon chain alpha-helix domain-containing protein [Thermomicrobiaceae bacterium]
AGELRVRRGNLEEDLAVFGGFIEVAHNMVRVLADVAERAEEIDLARAQAARDRAEARLGQAHTEIDLIRAEAALRRSLVRLRVAQHSRRHGRADVGRVEVGP